MCKHANLNNNNNNSIQRRISRFVTFSSPRCKPSPTRTLKWPGRNRVQITCNTSSAYHVQHVLPVTWYKGTAPLLSLTELTSHLFQLHFIAWTINQWGRRGNWSTWRKPLATSFRKCHILKPKDSSPKRDLNPHNSIGGRLGKQACQPLHYTGGRLGKQKYKPLHHASPQIFVCLHILHPSSVSLAFQNHPQLTIYQYLCC